MTSVPGARAVDDAVGAEEDRLDVRGVRDADDRDLGVATAAAGVAAIGRRDPRAPGARPGVRFQAVTAKPARARLAAIAAPIVPRPRKATASWSGAVIASRPARCAAGPPGPVGGVSGGIAAVRCAQRRAASSVGVGQSPCRARRGTQRAPPMAIRMMIARRSATARILDRDLGRATVPASGSGRARRWRDDLGDDDLDAAPRVAVGDDRDAFGVSPGRSVSFTTSAVTT